MPNGSKRKRIVTGTICPLETGSLLFGISVKPPSPSLLLSREITPMMPKDLKELSKNDLIRNKIASGREQDILDVKRLRAAAPEDL